LQGWSLSKTNKILLLDTLSNYKKKPQKNYYLKLKNYIYSQFFLQVFSKGYNLASDTFFTLICKQTSRALLGCS